MAVRISAQPFWKGVIMNIKKVTSAMLSFAVGVCSLCVYDVSAKVIEPEIVKTETWTTSYYIDDDIETLYPYIDCQADIYNDGTVKCYFWNTHEWDGFATVSHDITIIGTIPYSTNEKEYVFKTGGIYKYFNSYNLYPIDYQFNGQIVYTHNQSADRYYDSPSNFNKSPNYSFWNQIDLSWYSSNYEYSSNGYTFNCLYDNSYIRYFYCNQSDENSNFISCREDDVRLFSYYGSLAELPVNDRMELTFKPLVDITQRNDLHILSHDITITPEILSGKIEAEPQLSEQEKYIKQLEHEIADLKSENEKLNQMLDKDSILHYDINGDGAIDAIDASTLLTIYAINSTGGDIKTLTEFNEYNSNSTDK